MPAGLGPVGMKSPLHILHLEDDPNDAELIRRNLELAGIACVVTRVADRPGFEAALEQGGIDLVLSDFTLPTFDGTTASEITRARWPDIPFIFVTGTLGEERAVDALKSGVTDYVLKGGLARLAPAIRRACQEVSDRLARGQLEAQLVEAQKMEIIGQLASSVVHDFNNILAVIMGCGEWISFELGPDSPLQKYTDEIRDAAKRAAGLTQQLLIFSRKEAVKPVLLNLNDVVLDMDSMLRRLIGENIELVLSPGDQPEPIHADAGYLGQVLMNLVVNARDAMPRGGKLTITTGNLRLDESQTRAHPGSLPGEYALLQVSDTGSGMTEEVKARLFEAFFTTKPKGKGTGLGLATCHAIVARSGGHISVQSELGRGTTFSVYFPRAGQALAATARAVSNEPMPRGTETLLLVEDEPSVRHLARDVLKALGYEVLAASNGQEGLQVAREHKGTPIRLVVTDVVMPLMGGKVMAEWLKTSYPDLKVLFTSGYTDEIIARIGALETGVDFLPKPYTPATLTRKVREMLDAPESGAAL